MSSVQYFRKVEYTAQTRVAMTNQISVYELHRIVLAKRQKERDCFTSILDKCYSRIKRLNSMYKSCCIFDVPIISCGKPLFDLEVCLKFVIRNLTGNGFQIQYFPPRRLLISWNFSNRETTPAIDSSVLNDNKFAREHEKQQKTPARQQSRGNSSTIPVRLISEFRPSGRFSL